MQLSFSCAQEDQKRNPENKKPSSPTNAAPSEGASSYGYRRGRGGGATCAGRGGQPEQPEPRQMRDMCVCVWMSASVGVSIAPGSPVIFARVCLCVSLLRVIDNLESFSFPE